MSVKTKAEKVVTTTPAKSVKLGDVTVHNVNGATMSKIKKITLALATLAIIIGTKGLFLLKIGASKLSALYLLGDNGLKSGRTSANVYLRNGRIRQFRVPRLVRNAYTSSVRATFALFSGNFRGLTPDEIAAWNSYEGTASDRFGRAIKVTGKQAYIRLNALLASVGTGPLVIPPTGAASPAPTLNPIMTTNTITAVRFDYSTNADGAVTQLWATRPLSAGVSRPGQSQFVLLGTVDTSTGSPINFSAAYILRFGAPIVGSQIFIQLKVVNPATGLASAISQSSGSITT